MGIHTYYSVLGVSRDATPEEITSAKNALAKVYHPDANIQNNIDTTARMQEILEAYRVLSNPEKRRKYDRKLSGGANRVFRTYKVGEPSPEEETTVSFVTYWNAASKLNEIVKTSGQLAQRHDKKASFPQRILKKLGKTDKYEAELSEQMSALSLKAIQYISTLKEAEIPMEYWNPDAMNWLLVHWGQKQYMDYHLLFERYDAYVEQNKTNAEKLKLHAQSKQFHNNLKKLLGYAI